MPTWPAADIGLTSSSLLQFESVYCGYIRSLKTKGRKHYTEMRPMTPPTLTRVMLRTMLAELIAATPATPGPLEIAHLHLCKNAVAPTPDTLLADFIEADFDGYAAVTLTWGTVYSDAGGNSHVPGGLAEYVCTGSTHPNTIYGAYATNAGGTTLLWSYVFDTPVNVAVLGDAVITTPELVLTDPAT